MYNYTLKLSICKGFFEKKHIFYVLYKIDKTKHTIILKTNKRNFSKMHRTHKARKYRLPGAFGLSLSILHYFSKAPKEGSRKTVSFCHSPLFVCFFCQSPKQIPSVFARETSSPFTSTGLKLLCILLLGITSVRGTAVSTFSFNATM